MQTETIDPFVIPPFLNARDPVNAVRRLEARRNWKQRPAVREEKAKAKVKINRDAEGRPLPASMDEGSWALLRSIEGAAAKEEKARKEEAFRLLKVARDEKAEIKRQAKVTKSQGTACAPTEKSAG
jgi:hypothetical protein